MVREYEDKITSARFVMHVNSDQLKGAGLRKPTAPINKKNDLMGVPLGGNRSFIFFIGGCVRWLPAIT
jgi:hypothetical protein